MNDAERYAQGVAFWTINAIRGECGVGSLHQHEEISEHAASLSRYILEIRHCVHSCPSQRPGQVENVAHRWDYADLDRLVGDMIRDWFRSDDHCMNLLRSDLTHMGIGVSIEAYQKWSREHFRLALTYRALRLHAS
ncbi:hypothetical protein HYR82_03570 [Candidatus Peregrinibacteria bacterium]|nr:hypothetical protein [Candidatus Peregrinibacteria bacterium]